MKAILDMQTGNDRLIEISTVTQNQLTQLEITNISDFIVTTVDNAGNNVIIPICEIVGVNTPFANQVILTSTEAECCCAGPLRDELAALIGMSVTIATTGSGNFTNIANAKIDQVGDGLVIVEKNANDIFALSLCEIDYVIL